MSFSEKRSFGPTPKYDRVKEYKNHLSAFTKIAGPCSVESPEQIWRAAETVSKMGCSHLRGGVFRAGTYPSGRWGWVDEGLIKEFFDASEEFGLQNIIELLDYRDVDLIGEYCRCFQIGARQMQNYTLLKVAAESGKPVFLKRNPGATLDEWLGAAEWVLYFGCKELYLIERGSVSHVNHVRWDLSVSMIAGAKALTDIPVIVDASHGSGRRDLVALLTKAGLAAGANGCLIEFHERPDESLSDSEQALSETEFSALIYEITVLERALNGLKEI